MIRHDKHRFLESRSGVIRYCSALPRLTFSVLQCHGEGYCTGCGCVGGAGGCWPVACCALYSTIDFTTAESVVKSSQKRICSRLIFIKSSGRWSSVPNLMSTSCCCWGCCTPPTLPVVVAFAACWICCTWR